VIVVVQCQVRIFQLYLGENKIYIHFDEMMIDDVFFVLDHLVELIWIFIVIAHWNNSLQVDMSFHSAGSMS